MLSEKTERKSIEILSPAGSYDSFHAAIAAGADAVYAGGPRFGARAFAENFTTEQLCQAIDEAHLHGCRFYLTVNTLLKNEEIKVLPQYLAPLYRQGLDAVIVQDMGVLEVVRNLFPEMDIHASTQMAVTGAYGSSFLKEMGVTRVVPARELSLSEISDIKKTTGMEVECFVHGALCYSYSGMCLMSSMIGGRSGNRGQCAQPCRLKYQADGQSGYLLSLKDICTLEMIPQLIEAGIDSFKIEGRMKRPEYVAGVTEMYRKYTDYYLKHGSKNYRVEESDKERLMDLYNRGGFETGYYQQRNGRNMVSLNKPNHAGTPVIRVISQRGREITGKALTEVNAGDVVTFDEPGDTYAGKDFKQIKQEKSGSVREYMFGNTFSAGEQLTLLAPRGENLRKGTVLYRTRNQKLLKELEGSYVFGKKTEKIHGILKLSAGEPATLRVTYGAIAVECATTAPVEHAANRPLTEEQIRRQLNKTGNSTFVFQTLDISIDGEVFLPMQQFNELRRNALEKLTREVCDSYHRKFPQDKENRQVFVQNEEHRLRKESSYTVSALVENMEQLKAVMKFSSVKRIYLESELWETQRESIKRKCQCLNGAVPEVFVALPYITRRKAIRRLGDLCETLRDDLIKGVLNRNLECVGFLRKQGFDKEIVMDYSLYTMNGQAADFWEKYGMKETTLPLELNRQELAELHTVDSELIVYGRYPLMISAQCIQKTVNGCGKREGYTELVDRYRNRFPVRNHCRDCYNIVYNSKAVYLFDKTSDLAQIAPARIRFQFTAEDAGAVERILEMYETCVNTGEQPDTLPESYTRGHFYRGIM